jgi:hypothetical protein
VSFLRKSRGGDIVAFVVNATPVVRYNYRLGVPESGFYRELINTDGGSNVGNLGGVHSEAREWMGRQHSILISFAATGHAGVQAGKVICHSRRFHISLWWARPVVTPSCRTFELTSQSLTWVRILILGRTAAMVLMISVLACADGHPATRCNSNHYVKTGPHFRRR